jgi:hypothetical protein
VNTPVTVRRGWLLAIVGVCAGVVLAAGLIVRGVVTDDRTGTLCSIFLTQITESLEALGQPGSPGYAYYRTHPMERDQIVQRNLKLLGQLDDIPECTLVKEAN